MHIETWIPVAAESVGPARVLYLPTDPSVARSIRNLAPRPNLIFMLAMYGFFAAIGVVLFRALRSFDRMLGLEP